MIKACIVLASIVGVLAAGKEGGKTAPGKEGGKPAPGKGGKGAKGFNHVLVLSIDGLHPSDVDIISNDAASFPNFNYFITNGVKYTRHRTTNPSDSFPGLASILTGTLFSRSSKNNLKHC